MKPRYPLLIIGLVLGSVVELRAQDAATTVRIAPGESIQKAIDAAPAGAVITLAPGVFPERITINKPLTLQGAGWEKSILRPESAPAPTDPEKIQFVNRLQTARTRNEQVRLMFEFLSNPQKPTITIKSCKDVILRGIRIQGPAPKDVESLTRDSLVLVDDSSAQVIDCAVLGPFMNGVTIENGSDVEIRHSLVTAMWGTGVAVASNSASPDKNTKVHLIDSAIRNCYSRCVTIAAEGSTIEKCWICGSAWHGIRYDNVSPTIQNNRIFENARSGIYASGTTAATVRGNVFWKNEMDGISCWFNNADRVEGNTFADNVREGVAVLGDSKTKLVRNIIAGSPVGVACNAISQHGESVGSPKLQQNVFWQNQANIKRMDQEQALPEGNAVSDPKFNNPGAADFSLRAGATAGAITPLPAQSPWPIQPEEKSIIPTTDTRDYSHWQKPARDQAAH